MKCKRCKHTLDAPVKKWAKCPKCGLARFVGTVKATKKKEDDKPEEEK